MVKLRRTRRAGAVVALGVALVNLGGIEFIRQAYPADPFESAALANCSASEPGFVRFLPGERSRCYARQPKLAREITYTAAPPIER